MAIENRKLLKNMGSDASMMLFRSGWEVNSNCNHMERGSCEDVIVKPFFPKNVPWFHETILMLCDDANVFIDCADEKLKLVEAV